MIRDKSFIFIIYLSIAILFTLLGVNAVQFALILRSNGLSETFIGLSAVAEFMGGIAIAPFLSKFSKKSSPHIILVLSMLVYSVLILLIPNYLNFLFWLSLIFIIGICWFSNVTLCQGMLNIRVSDKNRGLFLAFSSIAMCSGISIGAALTKFFGAGNKDIFYLCNILALINACLYFFTRKLAVTTEEHIHVKIQHFIKKDPVIFVGKFIEQFLSTTILVFIVIYAVNNGIEPENAALLVSMYTANAIINPITGILVDRSENKEFFIKLGVTMAVCLIFILYLVVGNFYQMLILMFCLGFFIGMIYLSSLTILNSSYSKDKIIAANSAYYSVANIASISAGIVSGIALDLLGNIGIFIPVFILFIIFKIVTIRFAK